MRTVTDPAAEPGTDATDTTPTVDPPTAEPTTAPPTESAPPETTPPPPPPPPPPTTDPAPPPATTAPGDPAPATTAPTRTTAPIPPPPVVPPAPPAKGRPGVQVTTEDVTLTPAYWDAGSTATTLRVTVRNTGDVSIRIRLGYRLPTGLTDAGTPGCVATGAGGYRCGEWSAEPGARFSSTIRLRVAGNAWKSMPLSGSVQVTAEAPDGAGTAVDDEGFAVLFPPGPPTPGISLRADEVSFDISGAPSALTVHLGNTGKVAADGRVEVILPDGVTVTEPPAGCAPVAPDRTRCDVGTLPSGRNTTLRLPLAATPEAQRRAPLAGAVVGRLEPRSGRDRQVQMSFRITAAAALASPPVTPTPTGSQGVLAAAERQSLDDGVSATQRTAITLIVISGLLVLLALGLATSSLRRRMAGPRAGE